MHLNASVDYGSDVQWTAFVARTFVILQRFFGVAEAPFPFHRGWSEGLTTLCAEHSNAGVRENFVGGWRAAHHDVLLGGSVAVRDVALTGVTHLIITNPQIFILLIERSSVSQEV